MFHGVFNTSNIFLSLCGHELVNVVLGQGKGSLCVGKADGDEEEETNIKNVCLL